eukprot:538766-Hanusia_phi.AAC.1
MITSDSSPARRPRTPLRRSPAGLLAAACRSWQRPARLSGRGPGPARLPSPTPAAQARNRELQASEQACREVPE